MFIESVRLRGICGGGSERTEWFGALSSRRAWECVLSSQLAEYDEYLWCVSHRMRTQLVFAPSASRASNKDICTSEILWANAAGQAKAAMKIKVNGTRSGVVSSLTDGKLKTEHRLKMCGQ